MDRRQRGGVWEENKKGKLSITRENHQDEKNVRDPEKKGRETGGKENGRGMASRQCSPVKRPETEKRRRGSRNSRVTDRSTRAKPEGKIMNGEGEKKQKKTKEKLAGKKKQPCIV